MPLTFAETPLYYKDSQGQYHRIMSGADMTGYRTAAAQDAIDAAQDAEIVARAQANEVGVVITGARPSIAVTAGQYVIVRNSTISDITDGLYTANTALSPSTDVTAANLTAVSGGGLNDVRIKKVTTSGTTTGTGSIPLPSILVGSSGRVISAHLVGSVGVVLPRGDSYLIVYYFNMSIMANTAVTVEIYYV